ncbi:MAG: Lrp/AsnC family transcriptional regulator [Candidatus Thermoplasmatota archaeon]|jgi:Lrp/AsnC family leucine-responsive transcriptional regulator
MAGMDETNVKILQLLQKNARMTMTDLAQAVGRSESTVRERVESLELKGLLKGYQAQVDWDQAGLPALAVIQARCDMSRIQEVSQQLAAIPNVTRALLLTGPKPILAMLRVRDIQHLQSLLKERFAAGELSDIETQITLESLVDRRPPSLHESNRAPSLTT